MRVWPAIDLLGGNAVRLFEGRRDLAKIYHERPWELPAEFAEAGADCVHIVDLDGAFAGEPVQRALVARVIAAAKDAGIVAQVGGGIRSRAAVDQLIADGAYRVVLGTAAVKSPALVEECCRAYPSRIVVAVDARDGIVAVSGWTERADISAADLGLRAKAWGAAALLYTDVKRDGTGAGPAIEATLALTLATDLEVIASGGVSSLEDVVALKSAGINAVVIGRAIYDGKLVLSQAVSAADAGD
jgi:phosphoribosylformimino-5-aminoimidazole carboxamide ribotide isomerase